ncbi:MAG TPA: PIN domain-containing protein [Paracoccaceae bacterium]|nr:PIN domain-containing protein [Paracoccaceae bacterium]
MRAVLDACVLYPDLTRSLLLGAAEFGHFSPFWSPRILEEWARAAARDGAAAGTLARDAIAGLGRRWPEASVEPGPVAADLPDPDDLHVLGACLAAGASFLVTRNHRDFPTRILARFGVSRADPDDLLRAFAVEDARLRRLALDLAAATRDPPATLFRLAGLPRFARLFR